MRADLLTSILSELNGSTADIEASAVLSTDGLMMASMLPASMDEDRVGAMSAAMLSLGDRTARELARGALCKPNARLGLIFLDVKRASDAISKVI